MPDDIFFELHEGLPRQNPGRDRYTRQAYRMLPQIDRPRILDIGCGSGAPTLELAKLSQGEVIGIDTHQPFLDELTHKAEKAGLASRVRAVNCSMFDMGFPDGSFDIIWAEGSIYITGFERGLRDWRPLLKEGGFLVVSEAVWLRLDPPQEIADYWREAYPGIKVVAENLQQVSRSGYRLIGCFALPEDAWWREYYDPIEKRIKKLRTKYAGNRDALTVIDAEQREIDMYKKYYQWYGSAFFAMKKDDYLRFCACCPPNDHSI